MAKGAGDRYQDTGEVIRTLEAWLGVYRAGAFPPKEEQIARLEGHVDQFNTCGFAGPRRHLVSGFLGGIALAAVVLGFFSKIGWAFRMFGLALVATLAYFVLNGVASKGHLFTCTRRFVAGFTVAEWAIALYGFKMFCALLALLDVFWIWTAFALIGTGLAPAPCDPFGTVVRQFVGPPVRRVRAFMASCGAC